LLITATATLSVAVALCSQAWTSVLVRGEPPGVVASTVVSSGGVSVILVVAPLTVTVELDIDELPAASVAVQ
jgi:hypothetical protein